MKIAILGQGIAGTSIWWRLKERGITATIYDKGLHGSASAISAGVLNPITGRSFVKSWMVDELWPEAKKYYSKLEEKLDIKLWRDLSIHRPLKNPRDENLWLSKTGLKDHMDFMSHSDFNQIPGMNHTFLSMGLTEQCAVVNISKYLHRTRIMLEQENALIEQSVAHSDLVYKNYTWSIGDQEYDRIIYCTGAAQVKEDIWSFLPLESCRGDLCIIHSEDLSEDYIVKPDHMYIPMEDKKFWVGATFEYDHASHLPTKSGYRAIVDKIGHSLDHSHTVEEYHVGFRPTTIDRRPLLGEHPELPGIYTFNGLGSKGTSLSPYWSRYLVDSILNNYATISEVSVVRKNYRRTNR